MYAKPVLTLVSKAKNVVLGTITFSVADNSNPLPNEYHV
jgi:hypothetical protein